MKIEASNGATAYLQTNKKGELTVEFKHSGIAIAWPFNEWDALYMAIHNMAIHTQLSKAGSPIYKAPFKK